MPKLETEVANAVKARILHGEGSPYVCLVKELKELGFDTSDPGIVRRWVTEILHHRKIREIRPPQQEAFKFPRR